MTSRFRIYSVPIAIILMLTACSGLRTRRAAETNGDTPGLIYNLPKSILRVGIESKKSADGKTSELMVRAGTETVPDKEARLRIARSGNESFSRNHHFTFTNGLLQTVKIEDEGKSGEILQDLATIAMNFVTFGATPIPAPTAAPGVIPTDTRPTDAEIAAALASIAPGENVFISDFQGNTVNTALPGTGGLVTFVTSVHGIDPQKPPTANEGAITITNFGGIVTKLLEPYTLSVEINIDLKQLMTNRVIASGEIEEQLLERIRNNEKATNEYQKILDKPIPDTAKDEERISAEKGKETALEAKKAALDQIEKDQQLRKKNEEVVSKNTKNYASYAGRQPDEADRYFLLNTRSFSVLVPDFSPFVFIDLDRAPIGKTKYDVTLDKGVVVDFKAENPSAILEVIKVPLNISKAIVALPAEILKLKVDYSSKANELAKAEVERQKAVQEIAKLQAGATDHDKQAKVLEEEKRILELNKSIAELKKAINGLESE